MDQDATLLGIDLAWREHNPSGAARLERDATGRLVTIEARCLGDDDEIVAWIEEHAPHGPAVVAIDAPLIAPNPSGTGRPVDRETTRRFGRYHAGAYPANSEVCARSVQLAKRLTDLGWSIDPAEAARGDGRCALEVYPHAAAVGLFNLERIVKYKKGSVIERKSGLNELQDLLHERLPELAPPLIPFPREDVDAKRGRALKNLEDRLDAVLCAAMAAHLRHHPDECEVIGDTAGGYILVPRI